MIMCRTAMMFAACGVVMVLGGTYARADVITPTAIAGVSSELTDYFDRAAIYTINGYGLTGSTHSSDPTGTMWMTTGTLTGVTQDPLPAYITFDLGAAHNYNLTAAHIWNYNEAGQTAGGANDVTISVASSLSGSFTSLGSFVFNQASGLSTYAGDTYTLSANNVRLVRFDITSSFATAITPGANADLVGLSEVRFEGSPVPEPSTLTLLLAGLFGLLAYAWRKHR
jgi:hypothetical protein